MYCQCSRTEELLVPLNFTIVVIDILIIMCWNTIRLPLYVHPSCCLTCCAGSQANLHALIQLKPALSHLGDKGLLLLLRWVFITTALLTTQGLQYMLCFSLLCSPAASLNQCTSCFCCLGSCPFLKVSPTSMREVTSANSWTNGTRYYQDIGIQQSMFNFIKLLYINKTTL